MTWEVTVVCSTADSYINLTVQGHGCVAEMAASRKEAKYTTLRTHYDFQPIAVETLGPINKSATSFLYDLFYLLIYFIYLMIWVGEFRW